MPRPSTTPLLAPMPSAGLGAALAMALVTVLGVAPPVDADRAPVNTASAPADLFEETAAEAGCDASADHAVAEREAESTVPAAEPIRWRTSRGRDCRRYHGRTFCDGPRRVPEPHGADHERAAELGIDDERRMGQLALNRPPEDTWVEAIDGEMGEGLLWPVPDGRLWRGFGRHRVLVRRGGRLRQGRRQRLHRGVDIGAAAGSEIRAVNDGLVLYSFNGMRGYGNAVVLLHPDGTVTLYAHCRATFVFAGQRVRRGQVIAEVGHTGLAHGDHLHFEWRRNGRPRDPAPRFVDVPVRTRGDAAPDAPP